MRKMFTRGLLLALIFFQLAGGSHPRMNPADPMKRYESDSEAMAIGAGVGAAIHIVAKIVGQFIGDMEFAERWRDYVPFPFMRSILPPKGWMGWKEEILDLMGMATLGASMGSFGSGGLLAQQFQFGFTDAVTHSFLAMIAESLRGDKPFTTQPPFVDVVMVKIASQIIRDELIPADVPPFRGKTKNVLILNSAVEVTTSALIGALEGAALALLYTQVRDNEISLTEMMKQEMLVGAISKGVGALRTVVFFGPRVHVSESEKQRIDAYARLRGVDIRWALDHAQFRDIRYANAKSLQNEDMRAFTYDRSIALPHRFDPRNNPVDQYLGAHEAAHINQLVETPDWIYLAVRYPSFRRGSDKPHDLRVFERFPESLDFRK